MRGRFTFSQAARRQLLHLRRMSRCLGTSHGSSCGSSSTIVPHAARRRLLRLHCASQCLSTSRGSSCGSSSTTVPHAARRYYFTYIARPGASAHHAAHCVAHRRLLRLARLVVDYCASRGSSSTTSPTPRVLVPRHVARLVVWLVVDYCASRDSSRILCLRRASRCLGTSRDSSCGSSSTTSPRAARRQLLHFTRLVVDYFAYATRPGASARRVARCVAPCRLLCLTRLAADYFAYTVCPGASARHAAHRRLLRLRRSSRCLGTSCGSLSTTAPHEARRNYFAYAMHPAASAHHAARRRLLRLRHASKCLGTSHVDG
jgi:hypothetical protein